MRWLTVATRRRPLPVQALEQPAPSTVDADRRALQALRARVLRDRAQRIDALRQAHRDRLALRAADSAEAARIAREIRALSPKDFAELREDAGLR